jgi:hypothetical protein
LEKKNKESSKVKDNNFFGKVNWNWKSLIIKNNFRLQKLRSKKLIKKYQENIGQES